MRLVDVVDVAAPVERVFAVAAEVERWPTILSHYRWVTMHERREDGGGVVEMAAWRPFGPLRYPTWWMSKMWVDRSRWEVRYRHVRGVTREMDVLWRLEPTGPMATHIDLIHEWGGPAWPLIRRPAAEWVIGPVFIHGIASRTLAGIKRYSEAG